MTADDRAALLGALAAKASLDGVAALLRRAFPRGHRLTRDGEDLEVVGYVPGGAGAGDAGMSHVGGPDWFVTLFPLGVSVSFGPGHDERGPQLTRLEAAVFALWHGAHRRTSDEWVREVVPVTPAALARVKASVQRKFEAWQRWYWPTRGIPVLRPGRLFR